MSAHTPGQWSVELDPEGAVVQVMAPCYEHADCFKTIVFGPRVHDKPLQCSIGPNSTANAHLIAAAPELLEALKIAEEYVHLWMQDNTGPRELDHLEQIEKAIAKAEGRQA